MRKWIFTGVVVLVVVLAYYVVRTNARVEMPWNKPEFGDVTRGDITVPITASGLIEPLQKIDMKSKASGEVIQINVAEGDFVHVGDVLVLLRKVDEERSVQRAQADRDRVNALLAQARIQVRQAEQDIISAGARLERLQAEAKSVEFNLQHLRDYKIRTNTYSEQEMIDAESRWAINVADQKSAEAAEANAGNALDVAKENVHLQEAALAASQKNVEETEERLRETTILSRHDAIVTNVAVNKGVLIQSGTTSFTGGTKVIELADVSKKIVKARIDEAVFGRIMRISPVSALPDMPGLRAAAALEDQSLRTGNVRVTVDAFRDEQFEGLIERIEPQGKQNVGSTIIQFDVHVALIDPRANILPLGAQAQVEFTVDKAANCLRVPAEAVKRNNEQTGVWLKVPPPQGSDIRYGKQFLPCRVGITDGEYTQILSALGDGELKVGEKVYTKLPPKTDEDKDKDKK